MPPSASVQPAMFQVPGPGAPATASGTTGKKLDRWTCPVMIGTTPTIAIGTMTSSPIHFWTLAVPMMPRCWMAKTTSISAPPMKKAALREKPIGPK